MRAAARGDLLAIADLYELTWILPGQIAATAAPASRQLQEMRAAGVTLLVSLAPVAPSDDELRGYGLRCLHLPVRYMAAPSTQQLHEFTTVVEAELAVGGRVAVHCVGGLGRTGTAIACHLVSQGMPPEQAIALVRGRRPGSIESAEQANAVLNWAAELELGDATAGGDDGRARAPRRLGPSVRTARGLEASGPAGAQSEEGEMSMAQQGVRGYLAWGQNGSAVDVRALASRPGDGPGIEDLKSALTGFAPDGEVGVTLTETLGQQGQAWITVTCAPGRQGALLVATGQIIDLLVRAGVYDEVLLRGS
jgi:atypical dual specificity phosphatase